MSFNRVTLHITGNIVVEGIVKWVSEWVSYLPGKVENIIYGCLDVEWLAAFLIATGSLWESHSANSLLNVGVRSWVSFHSDYAVWWIASMWQRTCNHRLVGFLPCTGNCGIWSSNPLIFDCVFPTITFWTEPYVVKGIVQRASEQLSYFSGKKRTVLYGYLDVKYFVALLTATGSQWTAILQMAL